MTFNFIILIINFILITCRSQDDLHKFQQNSYRSKRYLKWKFQNKERLFRPHEVFYIFGAALAYFSHMPLLKILGLLLMIVDYYFFWLIKTAYPVKKGLVYTSRIKRMCVTNTLLMVLTLILVDLFSLPAFYISLVYLISFTYTLLSNIINAPIEKIINALYYRDAQKKLSDNSQLKIIGITGSYGKTSTKNVIATMLSKDFNVLMTPESFNTKMGITRTIREQLKPIHQVFIVEMGAKERGDIKELCDFVHPHMGLITSIGPQHLDTFKTLETIIATKGELFHALPKGGTAFVNADDENIIQLPKKEGVLYRSYTIDGNQNQKIDYCIEDISVTDTGSSFTLFQLSTGKKVRLSTKLLGRHNLSNILSGIAIALELGISIDRLDVLVKSVEPIDHRLSTRRVNDHYTILDDAYNSNPVSSKMALEVLDSFKGNHKLIITPGMIELADAQYSYNFAFGEAIASICDHVILVGKQQTKAIFEGLISKGYNVSKITVVKSVHEAFTVLNSIVAADDVVLIENDLPDSFNEPA